VCARKMHANELDTDVSLVGRLLAAQFPQWADLPIEPVLSAGTDNAIYRLGDDLAVRLPRIDWAVGGVDKDFRLLPMLAPLLPLAIPVPLAKGTPAEGYPWEWGVYRWLEGENPTVGRIADRDSLAKDLAQFIEALHRIDLTGGPPATRGVPLAMRDEPTRAAIAALRGTIDTGATTAAWEAALRTPAWSGPSVWIHGDLSPGNLLLQGDQLTAVIDFAGAGVGDPACDLIVAWNLLPTDARSVFRSELGVDAATWARGRGWALSVALIQLPYYRDTNPALAENARHVIREVLADYHGARSTGVGLVVERLPRHGLQRFREIDRSEEVVTHYRQVGKRLVAKRVNDSVPNFSAEGDFHSIPELVKTWQPVVDAGGVLLGAFQEGHLAGIALLGGEVAAGVYQVALLFVSRPHRGRGVATALMNEVEQLARNENARALYVSSVPSDSAVGFYLSRGFRPTDPLPELFAEEPEDIHMLLPLTD
jgi:aminoglycoside phosphotransferase (APT) family kinase protein/GNAT superfamily N-acetyltransferase